MLSAKKEKYYRWHPELHVWLKFVLQIVKTILEASCKANEYLHSQR